MGVVSQIVTGIDWFILLCFLLSIRQCRKMKQQNKMLSQKVKEQEALLTSMRQQNNGAGEETES